MITDFESFVFMSLGDCTCRQHLQWNPVNTVINGPKNFYHINGVAVLMRVFYKKMYGGFCQAAKKSGCNNEVTVLPR